MEALSTLLASTGLGEKPVAPPTAAQIDQSKAMLFDAVRRLVATARIPLCAIKDPLCREIFTALCLLF